MKVAAAQEPESLQKRFVNPDGWKPWKKNCKHSAFDHLTLQAFVTGLRGRNRNCHKKTEESRSQTEADKDVRRFIVELEGAC